MSLFVTWMRSLLKDPTSVMHLMGFVVIGGEIVQHWTGHQPVDRGTIAAGMGLLMAGGALDVLQGQKAA